MYANDFGLIMLGFVRSCKLAGECINGELSVMDDGKGGGVGLHQPLTVYRDA